MTSTFEMLTEEYCPGSGIKGRRAENAVSLACPLPDLSRLARKLRDKPGPLSGAEVSLLMSLPLAFMSVTRRSGECERPRGKPYE